ncbi:hypothetical protein [Alkalicoccus luteus]|uniref:hypothetical protein n=1 Tax=Alkalicoccus luteus TaxID=1237094 RepID=UPI00143AA4FF|nr:hypothetical protein [Alkalicoccus luteus]
MLLGIGLVTAYNIPFWINSYPDYYAFFHQADLYGLMILIIIAAALLPLHRMLQTWPLFFAASFTLLLLALSYGVYTRGTITSLSVGELFYVNVPATMSLLFIIGWAGLLAKFQSANKKQLIFCVFLAWITTLAFMILPNLKFAVIFLLISAIGIAFTQNKFRYRLTALIVTLAPFIFAYSTFFSIRRSCLFPI